MNQSSKEIGQPEQVTNNESKDDNSQVSPSNANAVLSAALSIQEGNKLIAEFLGYTYYDAGLTPCVVDFLKRAIPLNGLKYHTSWDWLMIVVEKIENLGFAVILQKGLCQIFSDKHPYSDIEFANKSNNNETSKIKLCYETILEFIKWYNDNIAAVGSR